MRTGIFQRCILTILMLAMFRPIHKDTEKTERLTAVAPSFEQ